MCTTVLVVGVPCLYTHRGERRRPDPVCKRCTSMYEYVDSSIINGQIK